MARYSPTNWISALGTFLNRFTKSNETTTEVELTWNPILTNSPTEFNDTRMNNIEAGIERNDQGNYFNPVTIESRNLNVDSSNTFRKDDMESIKIRTISNIADGTQLTVEMDDDGTTYNLYSDIGGTEAVTELPEGVYEVIFVDDTIDFFTLRPSGGLGYEIITTYEDRLYLALDGPNNLYELNPDTLAVLNTVSAPTTNPSGIGGLYDNLYHCENNADNLYELNPDTLAVISTVSAPSTNPSGIGGTAERLYHCDSNADNLYELNPSTLASINSASSKSSSPYGIGGTTNRLYHCDFFSDTIYELNLDTFATINSASSPSFLPFGVGGIAERLYHCDNSNNLYELNPDTLAVLNTVSAPSTSPSGIGGMKVSYELVLDLLKDYDEFSSIVYNSEDYKR